MAADLISLSDVAKRLAISPRGLRNLIATGRFGPEVLRLSYRCVRVREREFCDWILGGCAPAARWDWRPTA